MSHYIDPITFLFKRNIQVHNQTFSDPSGQDGPGTQIEGYAKKEMLFSDRFTAIRVLPQAKLLLKIEDCGGGVPLITLYLDHPENIQVHFRVSEGPLSLSLEVAEITRGLFGQRWLESTRDNVSIEVPEEPEDSDEEESGMDLAHPDLSVRDQQETIRLLLRNLLPPPHPSSFDYTTKCTQDYNNSTLSLSKGEEVEVKIDGGRVKLLTSFREVTLGLEVGDYSLELKIIDQ